jgi:hypothetical protein
MVQFGIRCAALGNWTQAAEIFRKAADIFELLFGNEDQNFLEVTKLFDVRFLVNWIFYNSLSMIYYYYYHYYYLIACD